MKKKVYSIHDELYDTCKHRVIISRDESPLDPLHDYDQVFLLHSNITREFCGNESDNNYDDPFVEIIDDEGYGTGEYKLRDGVIAFPVSAYIHSGIALRLGSIRQFACDPGGWDTTCDAAFMWTTKERYEQLCGKWMTVWSRGTPAPRKVSEEEFEEHLRKIAEDELKLFQDYLDGNCYKYNTEERVEFDRVYADGTTEPDYEYKDDCDSCGGFYIDDINEIDFRHDEEVEVFADDDCSHFVGDEWEVAC